MICVSCALSLMRGSARWLRPQGFEQAVGEPGCVQDFTQQQQAAPCVLVPRHLDQNLAHFRVTSKTLRALEQPDIQLTFRGSQIADKFRVITLGVIDQKARVNLEETG